MSSQAQIERQLARMRTAAALVRLRLRLSRALAITPVVLPVTLLLLAVLIAAHKVAPDIVGRAEAVGGTLALIAAPVVAWLVALLRPLPPHAGTLSLDKFHELHGRLTNALEFSKLPEAKRTPLMQAAIDEACAYVADKPRKATLATAAAAPLFAGALISWWAFPALLAVSGGLVSLAFVLQLPPPPAPPEKPLIQAVTGLDLSEDDLEVFRETAKEMEKKDQTPELKAALDKFNRLIEDLADKKLDRSEALRQMEALENDLLANSELDKKKLEDELKETAKSLDKSDLTKELADSLKNNDLKKAEKQLKDLANRLREKCDSETQEQLVERCEAADLPPSKRLLLSWVGRLFGVEQNGGWLASLLPFDPASLLAKECPPPKKTKPCPKAPNKEELKKLREALKKAVERRKEALAAINERRAEMREQLLKKKKEIEAEKDPKKKEEQEKLLKKKERELERLDRDSAAQEKANRELEKLDRELSQAAQDLLKEAGITPEDLRKAAEALDKAAEDLNRMDQKSMSEKDKQELKQKLEELRELIRQQGKSDKKRMSRMVKFSKRARGQQGKSGQSGQQGEDGEDGEEGEEGEEEGNNGKGKKGQGQGDGEDGPEGQGKGKGKKGKGKGKGQGDGEGDGLELSIGPGGVPIPMPGAGSGGDQPGPGGGKGGKDWGTGSGGPVAGDRTDLKHDTTNVQQEGMETNQGGADSRVILSAAEKGFRGAAYEKIFTEYKTVAEKNINKEEIPDGYRFYVRRYFQLIRPRD